MPQTSQMEQLAILQRVAQDVGVYPIEAYEFVQRGLAYTVAKTHGPARPGKCRHVTGQQLCEGLRVYALRQWGLMAHTVLTHWNITSTFDFGRLVFSMVDHKVMSTTDEDNIEDFRNVYDFRTLDRSYRIPGSRQ